MKTVIAVLALMCLCAITLWTLAEDAMSNKNKEDDTYDYSAE